MDGRAYNDAFKMAFIAMLVLGFLFGGCTVGCVFGFNKVTGRTVGCQAPITFEKR